VKRFIFVEGEDIGTGTIAYKVRREGEPEHGGAEVWWTPDTQRARCCQCSGPLQAMSAGCEHARALKRHLMKQTKPKRESGARAVIGKRIDRGVHRLKLEAARPKKRTGIDVYKMLAVRYQRIEPLYIHAVTLLGRVAGKRVVSGADRILIKKAMDDCAEALDGRFRVARTLESGLGWSLRPKSD
jgi:hypothetical protein